MLSSSKVSCQSLEKLFARSHASTLSSGHWAATSGGTEDITVLALETFDKTLWPTAAAKSLSRPDDSSRGVAAAESSPAGPQCVSS
jgi:hypothetical protein